MPIQTRRSNRNKATAQLPYARPVKVQKPLASHVPRPAPPVLQVPLDLTAQPKIATRQLAQLQRAIDDTRDINPYKCIVVKGTSQSAFYQLERVIAAHAKPHVVLTSTLKQQASDAHFTSDLAHICQALSDMKHDAPKVLQIWWDEKSQEISGKDAKNVIAMLLEQVGGKVKDASATLDKTTDSIDVEASSDDFEDIDVSEVDPDMELPAAENNQDNQDTQGTPATFADIKRVIASLMAQDPSDAPCTSNSETNSARDLPQGLDAPTAAAQKTIARSQAKKGAAQAKLTTDEAAHAKTEAHNSNPEKLWQTRLHKVYLAVHKAAPKTKLIIYTPRERFVQKRQNLAYEMYDARLLGWNADQDGFALRAQHLSRAFDLKLPEVQLKSVLRNTPFIQLEDIFDYARVIGGRQIHASTFETLRDAARNFADRDEDNNGYENIVDCLVDTKDCGQNRAGLEVPQGLREFTDVLRHFSLYQQVYTHGSKSLLFVGPDHAAKIALIKDLAADLNALLVVPPASDLLDMIAEDTDEAIEGFLNRVTQHANACGRSAIVYLGELDALLALGEKVEGSLGFNVIAAQLSKLCGQAGRADGWEDLVVVLGTQQAIDTAQDPLASIGFRAKTCAPTGTQLAAVLRSCLAQAHPSHHLTDAQLEQLATSCLRTKSPFHVDDVEQMLQRAARIAFCQRRPNKAPVIEAAHVRLALEDTYASSLVAAHLFYS